MITSTFLTLLVIPTIYEIIDGMRTWFAEFLGRWVGGAESWRAKTAEHPVPDVAAPEEV